MSKQSLHIRDLGKTVVNKLKRRAKRNQRSLQAEVRLILEDAARRDWDAAWAAIDRFRKEFEARGREFSDSTKLIRQDRAGR